MIHVYLCKECNELKASKEILHGEHLVELVPHSKDETNEKHVPVIEVEGKKVTVKIGAVPHPMTEAHLITDIYLETDKRVLHAKLAHTDAPQAEFELEEGETLIAAYDYCNLHGLWVKEN